MRKPWVWLRIVSIVFLFFALAHALGTLMGGAEYRDVQEQSVMTALKAYRFDVMGTMRSHYDFYMGMNWLFTITLVALMIVSWQLASASRVNPRAVRPVILTLCAMSIAFTIVSWLFFFPAPLVTSALAAIGYAIAAWAASA
jgi:hypothetical protein